MAKKPPNVRFYCKCGAKMTGTVPSATAEALEKMWEESHNKPGCGPATPKQASRARKKAGE